jgi:cell division protein FtsX
VRIYYLFLYQFSSVSVLICLNPVFVLMFFIFGFLIFVYIRFVSVVWKQWKTDEGTLLVGWLSCMCVYIICFYTSFLRFLF